MSRYYDISITVPGDVAPIKSWTSHPNGVYDPQAQNVLFDLFAYNYSTPKGASTVSIEGITIGDIGEANSWTGMTLQVKGGMKKGLPLANPLQAGTLLTGQIFQAWGNWEGTDMTLDFVMLASPFTFDVPGNFVLNWKKGAPVSGAISSMLAGAFPDSPRVINVSPNRVLDHDAMGYYHTLEEVSTALSALTAGQFGPSDRGVLITLRGDGGIVVTDGTQANNPVKLNFNDFIGQPAWIAPYQIQLKLVLRADLSVGTTLIMPTAIKNKPGIVTTQSASLPSYTKQNIIFQGNFIVTSLRHVGNFRDANGAGWITLVNAITAESAA